MKEPIEQCQFAGDTLEVYPYGPDFEIKVNGKHHGVFLSPAAAISSAQKYITITLQEARRAK